VIHIRYRILDVNGDMQAGKGQQDFTYGAYAVGQAIQTRLKLLKGEWWEDLESGLPLFNDILGKSGTTTNITITDSYIKEIILGTKDVTGIEEFTSTFDSTTRVYIFNCKVNTLYGIVIVSNTL
jgi:hypothetical protein